MKLFRTILLLLHLGLLFLLLGVLLNAYIPPKVFPWFNLLPLGFPLLMAGYILLTLFWIFSRKKRAFVFMLVGLLFLNPARRWVNFSSPGRETADLKVITFNVKGGRLGKENIQNYINKENPDIVLLQEDGGDPFIFSGLQTENEMRVISLYSKHKIVGYKKLIAGSYEYFNAYSDCTDLEIKGKTYRIINTYLQPFKFKKSMVKLNGNSNEDEQKIKDIVKRLIPTFKMHQEQIEIIRKSIDESPYPVILAGDFNSVPSSYEYYHLGKGLKDSFIEAGYGSGTSFHDYKFPLRIDYIFTSGSIRAVTYKVDRSVKLSDHFPVVATFTLK